MLVQLIAHTTLDDPLFEILPPNGPCRDADNLAEFAGRACYQSFHRPNPRTRKNVEYVGNILDLGHESVLEHASATFYITGVSRSLTHELIRHRHLSFSELSQRYVNMSGWQLVQPPAMRDNFYDTERDLENIWESYAECYDGDAEILQNLGLPRKRAREAARWNLPNSTETRIVVTGNMRAWRHVIQLRGSEHADAEIRELAVVLFYQLAALAPSCFQDLACDTLEDGREVITKVEE